MTGQKVSEAIRWVAEVGTGNIGSKDVEEVRINLVFVDVEILKKK